MVKLTKETVLNGLEEYEKKGSRESGISCQKANHWRNVAYKNGWLQKPNQNEEIEEVETTPNTLVNGSDWSDILKFDMESEISSGYKGKMVCICGLPAMGKTTLLKDILNQYRNNHFVYDLIKQFKGFTNVTTKKSIVYPDNQTDFNLFGKFLLKQDRKDKNKPLIIGIDEIDLLLPSNRPPSDNWAVLLQTYRHYGLNLVYTTRRPAKVYTDLVENSHYLISFKINGENNINKLNQHKKGLGNEASKLKEYEYIIYDSLKDEKILISNF